MPSLKKKALGRGLEALIPLRAFEQAPESAAPRPGGADESQILFLDPRLIRPNPKQPRTSFREEGLEELADSIKHHGMQEPVIVRRAGPDYELVSGERRVRAAVMADLDAVPAICREVSDRDMLKLGLIENIQREDLNAIELAHAYQTLVAEFSWTQEELASQVGKKRATVTNSLRLLNLPADVQNAVAEGSISMGHARALLAFDSPKQQSAMCRKVIEQDLSVRQIEKLASFVARPARKPPERDPNLVAIEDEVRRILGTRVRVRGSAKNRGKIEIEFYNLDDLERILHVLRSTQ